MVIAKSAIIEDGAILEDGVEIGEFCFVSKDATIKKGTKLAFGVRVMGATTIGERNVIESYAIIGGDPQSIKYDKNSDPHTNRLEIGDDNRISEFVTISRGTYDFGGVTKIGNRNFLMNYVHIAHDCKIGDGNIFANNATLAGHVEIGDYTNIGGLTPIHQFVKIGDYCMIAGASALSQDIPHYTLAEGNRAKIRGINRYALRKSFDRETINRISKLYKRLFSGEMPIKELAQIELEKTEELALKKILTFILDSKRGIPYKRGEQNEQ